MKRIVFLMMAIAVAMSAAATDRFYLEDFSIAAGETRTVEILLDNEEEYTAFQADLYLPEGLTIANIALTSRKNANHTLSVSDLPDGGKRMLSYSIRVMPYSGNSGALVTMDVTANASWKGPSTIALRNIVFTTTTGSELSFADETCTVTLLYPGDVNMDETVDVDDATALINKILGKAVPVFNAANADMNGDSEHDISDVSAIINLILGK